jgi:hypothetical protein
VAAGCSNGGGHPAAIATASAPRSSAPCKLDRVQHRAVARALADIRRLRRIQAPMQTFSQHGAPNQNAVTGKLMLDLGSANLPLNVFARLLYLGKVAVSLCGDCSVGLEGEEPVLANQGRSTVDNCSAWLITGRAVCEDAASLMPPRDPRVGQRAGLKLL